MTGLFRKKFIFKPDSCFGFSFDDNKTCAVLHQGVETILTFLGDSCCLLGWKY